MDYATRIKNLAPGYSPRHIEAYMRLPGGTLDALSPGRFKAEVDIAKACIDHGGPEAAERLALSYGL